MRKILLGAVLCLGLAGCAQLQALRDTASTITQGYTQVVTPENLAVVEAGATAVYVALNTYADQCDLGNVPPIGGITCKEVISRIQVHTRKIPGIIVPLRKFVRENRQPDALRLYEEVKRLINAARNEALSSGVPLRGV